MMTFKGLTKEETELVNRYIQATITKAQARSELLEGDIAVDLHFTEHSDRKGKTDLLLISDITVTKKMKPEGEVRGPCN